MENKIESKLLGGRVSETKIEDRNGVKVGIIEGYIATWDLDRGDFWGVRDQFIKGAFAQSLSELRLQKRQVRFKDHHGRTIGGFPIETVKEDDVGLFGVGEINLEVQQGREAFSLAKQGVLTDFSVGFSVEESTFDEQQDIRTIRKAILWEGSIVDEPMNPFANITAVKSMQAEISSVLDQFKGEELSEDLSGKIKDALQKASKSIQDKINEDVSKITMPAFEEMTVRDIERTLKCTKAFTDSVCKLIASKSRGKGDEKDPREQDDESKQKEQEQEERERERKQSLEFFETLSALRDECRAINTNINQP